MSSTAEPFPAVRRGRAPLRTLAAHCASVAGLPLLVALVYTNASDIAMRGLGLPSLLQPVIVGLGAAALFARRELGAAGVFQPLTAALVAWTTVVIAGTVWARDLGYADERAAETVKGLILFAVIAALAASWRALRLALFSIAASAPALAFLTFAQVSSDGTSEFLGLARGQSAPVYGDVVQMRASGPLGDPNFFAQILLFAVPLAVFTALDARRLRTRMLCFLAGVLALAAMLLTYSRGAMVALLVMLALTLAAIRIRPRHALTAGVAAAVIALMLFVLPVDATRRLATMESLLSEPSAEQDSSIEKRKLLLSASWRMFEEHPLLGVGPGNFGRSFDTVRNEVGFAPVLYEEPGTRHFPHNLYFEIAAENGLAGIVTFGAAIAAAFVGLRDARRRLEHAREPGRAAIVSGIGIALAGYLVSSLFLHGAFQRYLWMLFALVAAVVRLTRTLPRMPDAEEAR